MHKCSSLYVLAVFAVGTALLAGCNGGNGSGMVPSTTPGSESAPMTAGSVSRVTAGTFGPQGDLDCNGLSTIQRPIKRDMVCTDFAFGPYERGEDNGKYIGHDEPSIGFYSQRANSGNNVQWKFRLPFERPVPATQTFENTITFWQSLAVCDPKSYPQNPCTPDSDVNLGGTSPRAAGSAVLELQLYPPGFSPFITQISCDTTHWCAALNIDSLECTLGFGFCNPKCTEPANFAFLQTDGVPTGPPGPNTATNATFTPNGRTLLMNQGDVVRITTSDTKDGLITRIDDLTSGRSGFMVASAANGFENTDLHTCAGTKFAFHPEFATARASNIVPWAALQVNVNIAFEIGHFTPGKNGDNDVDDAPCFPGPTLPGCIELAVGGDLDFDGSSYVTDWPDGTANHPEPVLMGSVLASGIGPVSGPRADVGPYVNGYNPVQFETDAPASTKACMPSGFGCTVPPLGAKFYPFYTQLNNQGQCVFSFGNDISGHTTNDFGKDAQFGKSNVPWFFGTSSGGFVANPCPPA